MPFYYFLFVKYSCNCNYKLEYVLFGKNMA